MRTEQPNKSKTGDVWVRFWEALRRSLGSMSV